MERLDSSDSRSVVFARNLCMVSGFGRLRLGTTHFTLQKLSSAFVLLRIWESFLNDPDTEVPVKERVLFKMTVG